jgi:hypothetical protein
VLELCEIQGFLVVEEFHKLSNADSLFYRHDALRQDELGY